MQVKEREVLEKAVTDPISTIRALTQNNLYFFIQYFWPEYSQQPFSPNWHLEYICKELEKVARDVAANKPREHDLIINVPPGTTKTAMVSIFFNIWCWTNWFHFQFITASYTHPLALESAEYAREIMRSARFKQVFPELDIKEDKDTKSNFRVIKREWLAGNSYAPRITIGGFRFSTSVGGSVTGFHGHINIVDDPLDPNMAQSEQDIKTTNHWMDNVIPMRKVDKKVTVTILIMQRLHQEDPTGHWLKVNKKVKHICLPGEIRNYRSKVKPPELVEFYKNELLDQNRLGWDALNEILMRGQYTYGGQVGQDPIPLGGGMFKTDKIVKRTTMPHHLEIVDTVRYWDKAATEGGEGARTAGCGMSRLKNGKFLIWNIKKGRWSTDTREAIIKSQAEADTHKCRVGVEQEPGSGGKESADATVKNLAGFVTKKDRPVGNKALRADPLSVQVNIGNVEMLEGDWNEEYIDEMKNFPNSTHKDQIDASSGAFNMLVSKKQAGSLRAPTSN